MLPFLIRSPRVVFADGVRPASIYVRDGRIADVRSYGDRATNVPELDAGELALLPGLVDTHVHINDPGRADWEGFEHATRAAAAGGVTTLVDMPLNSIPPTIDVAGLEAKRAASEGRCHVDVGFWGGVVPGNSSQLRPLARAGVLGFKCFLCPSGVEEFAHVSEKDLRDALPVLADLHLPLLAHAELPDLLASPGAATDNDPRRYQTWLSSRPPAAEHAAIELLGPLGREFGAAIHIVHLASADALPIVADLRRSGLRLTVETCPHYLTFAAEDVPDGATAFKCAPPIRSADHRERLWQALTAGHIDFVVSDHSPSPPEMKHIDDGDFIRAWGGIASLQVGLAAVWTGAWKRGVPIERVASWMAASPARFAGIDRRKGRIEVGRDADLVIWDPEAETAIDPESLYHRHPVTPYAGLRLRGRVHATLVRGRKVYDDGEFLRVPAGSVIDSSKIAGESW